MSMRPKVAMVWRMRFCTSADSETSVRTKIASPPSFRTIAAVSSPSSGFQSETTTFAPSFANRIAAARPCPLPAPVIIATLFPSRMFGSPGMMKEDDALRGRDDSFGGAPQDLAHHFGTLRTNQRIVADEERRNAADTALMSRKCVVLELHRVARGTDRLGDLALVEAGPRREPGDQRRVADVEAIDEIRAIDECLHLLRIALLPGEFAGCERGVRAGENRRRLDRQTLGFGHRRDPLPDRLPRVEVGRASDLFYRNSLGGPFRMDLVAAPFQLDVEFRFELADYFEADVAERAYEVGKHHDPESHGAASALTIGPACSRRQKPGRAPRQPSSSAVASFANT